MMDRGCWLAPGATGAAGRGAPAAPAAGACPLASSRAIVLAQRTSLRSAACLVGRSAWGGAGSRAGSADRRGPDTPLCRKPIPCAGQQPAGRSLRSFPLVRPPAATENVGGLPGGGVRGRGRVRATLRDITRVDRDGGAANRDRNAHVDVRCDGERPARGRVI